MKPKIEQLTAEPAAGLGIQPYLAAYVELQNLQLDERVFENRGELQWLADARERSYLIWSERGLPKRTDEAWHYLNVAELGERAVFLPSTQGEALFASEASAEEGFPQLPALEHTSAKEETIEITFLNGKFIPKWSRLNLESSALSSSGLRVELLSQIIDECHKTGWTGERLEKLKAFRRQMETTASEEGDVFSEMNTTFQNDAIFITADSKFSGPASRVPIIIKFLTDPGLLSQPENVTAGSSVMLIAPRVYVSMEEKSELSLIELHSGRGEHCYFSTSVSDVEVGAHARLSYVRVQLDNSKSYHVGTARIRQGRDSFVETQQFSFGASLSRQTLEVRLEGEGAEASVDGLYVIDGEQKCDHHTFISHAVPHTTSRQLYKGILAGKSRAIFNGRIAIQRDAQKASAAQLNQNLLLSSKAEIDTKPELDILADDVKASHGATIGQMDSDHLFYLQSRAIPKAEAIKMLSHGFAKEVACRLQSPLLRKCMEQFLDLELAKRNLQ